MNNIIFRLVTATDLASFEEQVNKYLNEGYMFIVNQPTMVTPIEGGVQYSTPLLLQKEVQQNG